MTTLISLTDLETAAESLGDTVRFGPPAPPSLALAMDSGEEKGTIVLKVFLSKVRPEKFSDAWEWVKSNTLSSIERGFIGARHPPSSGSAPSCSNWTAHQPHSNVAQGLTLCEECQLALFVSRPVVAVIVGPHETYDSLGDVLSTQVLEYASSRNEYDEIIGPSWAHIFDRRFAKERVLTRTTVRLMISNENVNFNGFSSAVWDGNMGVVLAERGWSSRFRSGVGLRSTRTGDRALLLEVSDYDAIGQYRGCTTVVTKLGTPNIVGRSAQVRVALEISYVDRMNDVRLSTFTKRIAEHPEAKRAFKKLAQVRSLRQVQHRHFVTVERVVRFPLKRASHFKSMGVDFKILRSKHNNDRVLEKLGYDGPNVCAQNVVLSLLSGDRAYDPRVEGLLDFVTVLSFVLEPLCNQGLSSWRHGRATVE